MSSCHVGPEPANRILCIFSLHLFFLSHSFLSLWEGRKSVYIQMWMCSRARLLIGPSTLLILRGSETARVGAPMCPWIAFRFAVAIWQHMWCFTTSSSFLFFPLFLFLCIFFCANPPASLPPPLSDVRFTCACAACFEIYDTESTGQLSSGKQYLHENTSRTTNGICVPLRYLNNTQIFPFFSISFFSLSLSWLCLLLTLLYISCYLSCTVSGTSDDTAKCMRALGNMLTEEQCSDIVTELDMDHDGVCGFVILSLSLQPRSNTLLTCYEVITTPSIRSFVPVRCSSVHPAVCIRSCSHFVRSV